MFPFDSHVNSGPLDVVFSFDTTLSMIGVIERVRRDIEMITTRLFNNIPDLRLAVFAHGDYDSPNYIIKCLDFTNKADDVNKVGGSGILCTHAPYKRFPFHCDETVNGL